MSTLWLMWGTSLVGLIIVVVLLRIEERRGHRMMLVRLRHVLDTVLGALMYKLTHVSSMLGGGVLRHTLHFIVHRFLRLTLALIRKLESLLRRLQRSNKRAARSVAPSTSGSTFEEVREHASAIKLSPEEKRQKRRELLE